MTNKELCGAIDTIARYFHETKSVDPMFVQRLDPDCKTLLLKHLEKLLEIQYRRAIIVVCNLSAGNVI